MKLEFSAGFKTKLIVVIFADAMKRFGITPKHFDFFHIIDGVANEHFQTILNKYRLGNHQPAQNQESESR
jgi:hypothetical protein